MLKFWSKYFKVVSSFMVIIGLFWVVAGVFDPLGIYEKLFANHFWQTDTPPEAAQTTFRFLMIPFGATLSGYFVMQYLMIHFGFPAKLKWVWTTLVAGILTWFCTDTLFCLIEGAYFNIALANVSTIILMVPLFFIKKYFTN